MTQSPFAPIVAALPVTRPFVAPEELARTAGFAQLLRLGANESSFGPPPGALEAMTRELVHTSWYGDPESAELRDALASRHACAIANVVVASGIDDLLGLAVRAFLAPGDASVSTRGTYPTYAYHVTGFGARHETVSYRDDGHVDLAALAERARAVDARLVYLANPDNPSGTFATRDDVATLLAALPERATLVLDEAYGDFVDARALLPDTLVPRLVRMRTFSKAYGLAGARIAYAIADAETIEAFGKIRLQYGVNRTAQIGALAALQEQAFVSGVIAEVARGRDAYVALAKRHELATIPSHTNFVCIDLGSRERAEAMVEALLRLGVFIRKPGAPPLDGHIRVTVGTADERDRFAELFDRALTGVVA